MSRRTRLRAPNLAWDGRSKWWPHPDPSGVTRGDSNVWMCAEDLGLEIWTHFRRLETHGGDYHRDPVTLRDCSGPLEAMLADSLPFSDYHRNLSGAVVGFAKVVAQELMLTGELSFEIKIAWTDEGHTLIG